MINIETLKQMSDAELNELAAIKVMGWEKQSYDTYGSMLQYEWVSVSGDTIPLAECNPTGDMNDVSELLEKLRSEYFHIEMMTDEEYWKVRTNTDAWVHDHSLTRAITIASILAKGEDKSD